MDRKEFFKKIMHSAGDVVTEKIEKVQRHFENEPDLTDQEKEFLVDYTLWLTEFQYFVAQRSKNAFDIENNKKLMALSAEAEQRKVTLESFMKNPLFFNHFNQITREITALIA